MTPVVAAVAPDRHVRPRRSRRPRRERLDPSASTRGTPAVASTLAVHGCIAPAASGVNERAAVRSNTAHAPAHFTPALIDRCPSGPLSFTPSFPFLCLPFSHRAFSAFSRTCSQSARYRRQCRENISRGLRNRDCPFESAMAAERRRFALQIDGSGLGKVIKVCGESRLKSCTVLHGVAWNDDIKIDVFIRRKL